MDRANTNRNPNEGESDPPEIRRFKIVEMLTEDGEAEPRDDIAIGKMFNGVETGNTEFPIRVFTSKEADDEIFACIPLGGTGLTYNKDPDHTEVPVVWVELGGVADKGLYQGDIHQMVTDETAAWGPAQFGP